MKRYAILLAVLWVHCTFGTLLRKSSVGINASDSALASDSLVPYVLDRCTEVKEVFGSTNFIGKDKMSLKVCYTFCAARKAFYFGVSKGNKCWCGSTYQARIGGSSVCDEKCEGDKQEYCGGKYAHSVYIMGKGPCDAKDTPGDGDSDDKNLGEANAALEKVVKEAEAVVSKKNMKEEIKGGKLVDEAKDLLAEAMGDMEGPKPDEGAAKKKRKQAKAKMNKARKVFKKMESFGSKPTQREQQVKQDLKTAEKFLGEDADVATLKKASDQLKVAAAKPPPKRAIERLGVDGFKSFEFMGLHHVFLRHAGFRLKADRKPEGPMNKEKKLYTNDATFEFMPPLLPSADGGVSIRSKNFPDRYLRHKDFKLVLDPPSKDLVFQRDSTFFFVRPNDKQLAASGAHLLRSENFPYRYIHVRPDGLAYLDTLAEGKEKEFAFKLSEALAVEDSCEVTGKCECIPCGTATPKRFPSGTCAPSQKICSAKSPANPGCYTNCVRGCDCAKRTPVPKRCDCIPCGTATPKAFPSGACAPASGTCSAAAAGPGCYTKCEANCNCATRTCSP